ncbi:MAG: RNB domain-containing ribonuclease [Synechococcus sp.]|nr:RNB domain-containing ribonuclease [Synechococcus sp.]
MKFSVSDLLDQLRGESVLPVEDLEKKLALKTAVEKSQLSLALQALERVGVLQSAEAGISRQANEEVFEARLRCSSKGFCFALREGGGEDVYIRDHQLNHAWNGDRVLIKVTREGGRRRSPEGGVQCILERANTTVLAQVERQGEQLQAVPLDDRLQNPIQLGEVDAPHVESASDAVVEVELDRFPVGQYPAQGHVRRSLSIRGSEADDRALLMARHRLSHDGFSGRATLRVPGESGRVDLTALPTLLFQGGGKDSPALPAVSLESLEEGGVRLWVHAPSIGERLGIETPLERWLRQQGEAISLGSAWVPLLTPALQKAAVLAVGKPQDTLSVALDLTASGELLHYRFCRAQVQVDGAVDPKALTAFLGRKPKARTTPVALKGLKDQLPMLEQLQGLVELLRQRRLAEGSLELALPLPELDSLQQQRLGLPDQRRRGWHQAFVAAAPLAWLQELIRPAEQALGRHLAALELPALFLTNAAADPTELNDLVKLAIGLDVPLELGADGNAPAAQALAEAFADTDRSRVLQQQLREVTCPVEISAEPGGNALAAEAEAYAPWCCASLHYSAIWNQMLLASLLTDGKDRPSVRHKNRLDLSSDSCHGQVEWALLTPSALAPYQEAMGSGLVNRLNARARLADEAEADCLALVQARGAEALVGQTIEGRISGIQSYGFFVELPPTQVEGLVHVSSLKDDWYEYRSRQHRLVGRKNRRTYKLGDTVEVEVLKVDVLRHQIDLAVVLPEGEGSADDADNDSDGDADNS